jgi:hypothetical protein
MVGNCYIGILLDGLIYSGIKRNTPYFEKISFYEDAAEKYKMKPCFFRLKDICLESHTIQALIKKSEGNYRLKEIPIPLVIHNRGLFFAESSKKKLKNLQKEGITVFNDWNRYGKMVIHHLLQQNQNLIPHLPDTISASKKHLIKMMEKHQELIVKPNSGSLGGGIVKVTRISDVAWEMSYNDKKSGECKKEVFLKDGFPPLLEKKVLNKRYIIQQRIPLATYQGRPFDMRVSVQRNGTGEWQVTGIVGKVARTDGFVTNVAKGGSCKSLEILLRESRKVFEDVYHAIEELSLNIVKELSIQFPHLADVGLDVGITEEGFPMFIECNGRDLRITFKKANMYDTWKDTYDTPMSYGRFLLDSIKERLDQ